MGSPPETGVSIMRSKRTETTVADADTRARLLQCAAETFAERGFRDATVREVCREAGANVAAVNYHFGSKEELYLAALRAALSHSQAEVLVGAPPPRTRAEAKERLRAQIRGFVRHMVSTRPEWQTKLIMREIFQPTAALDVVVREFMAPRFQALKETLAFFLEDADDRILSLHAMSVIGQVLYHRAAAPVALRLLGEKAYGPKLLDEVAEHIVGFTERALEGTPR